MKLKKIVIFCSLVVAVGIIFVLLEWMSLKHFADQPISQESRNTTFMVKSGQSVQEVANDLYGAGLVANAFKFKLLVKLRGLATQLKAGEYRLAFNMSPNQILEVLSTGKVQLHRVTIPEGFTIKQIGALLQTADLMTADRFEAAAFDPDRLTRLNIHAQSVEGYLFPDTYYFSLEATPEKIICTMVKRFWQIFTPKWVERAKTLGYSVHQIVILASIIEKETGVAAERPLISSVFHNRLHKRMRLESDPTVIYGIEDFDGNLKKKHLKTVTPYNTYRIRGLPQGPIANPGADALKAALFPADTHYLYFVAKHNHTHYFSNTLKEHNRAVRKYQMHRRRR